MEFPRIPFPTLDCRVCVALYHSFISMDEDEDNVQDRVANTMGVPIMRIRVVIVAIEMQTVFLVVQHQLSATVRTGTVDVQKTVFRLFRIRMNRMIHSHAAVRPESENPEENITKDQKR